ncbi:3-keto-disaccharide hydrolase [Pirellulaceae bacterium SH501]
MRKLIVGCALVLGAAFSPQPAFAIKEFGEAFGKKYVEASKNEDFKKLAAEAKCNVCHIDGENKKKRNPYGEALHDAGFDKDTLKPLLKSDPEKAKKEMEAMFAKVEELKAKGSDKTFGAKINAGELPGGDVKGKQPVGKLISFVSTAADEGFKSLFDGKSFSGWKINENEKSWSIEDGAFVCQGERSHLFYVGDDKPFKNFHLKVEVKTMPNSNGGIYFHTKYQDSNWPKHGFEVQVNNSYDKDPRRTSSLYAVKDVAEPAAKDNVWYTQEVIVQGKKVTLKVDGKTIVEYEEPASAKAGKDFTRVIDEGTFALQCHDPGSRVYFRNIQVKRLD